MLNIFKSLFGLSGVELNAEDLENGTILDVRTAGEFRSGHVPGSINIPLQELDRRLLKLRQFKSPIIACCASGNRSGMAARKLNELDVKTINGGSWKNVDRQVK
jgi:rhodanese-related sulfurtransferase